MRLRRTLPIALLGMIALLGWPADWASAGTQDWRDRWPRTDFSQHAVPLSEFVASGPGKDGIPAIDEPAFVPVAEADLASRSPVLALTVHGDARAYPLSVLMWHEIVNDRVGGVPVTVTFCPLCNSGLAFERTVNGRKVVFAFVFRAFQPEGTLHTR